MSVPIASATVRRDGHFPLDLYSHSNAEMSVDFFWVSSVVPSSKDKVSSILGRLSMLKIDYSLSSSSHAPISLFKVAENLAK